MKDIDDEERLPQSFDTATLARRFHLSDADLREVRRCRGVENRLLFALQLCLLRWRGHFLKDIRDVPWEVLEYIARQLGLLAFSLVADALVSDSYDETRLDHYERIRRYLGFVRCGAVERQKLLSFLVETAQITPKVAALHEAAYGWLAEQKIVRPARTTLLDIIQTARERGLQSIYAKLDGDLSPEQRTRVDTLLSVAEAGNISKLEQFKAPARQESPEALLSLLTQLQEIQALELTDMPQLGCLHPALQRLLATWGYRHDVWSLRRFPSAKRSAIVLCFLHTARAEITDAIIEMQDKLITRQHNKAKQRHQALLRAAEQTRSQAIEALETLGTLVLDEAIPDELLRTRIFAQLPTEHIQLLVTGCRQLKMQWRGGDTSHLGFLENSYAYTRRYSPPLLEAVPFVFGESSPSAALGEAVTYLREINRTGKRKLSPEAPVDFLPRRWQPHVRPNGNESESTLSRPHYEMAVLTTLNERLKSGDVTVTGSRRWTDFEDYLLPKSAWAAERSWHYELLELPQQAEHFVDQLHRHLREITDRVEKRIGDNAALTIDGENGTFRLAALKGEETPASVNELRNLLQAHLPRTDLVDLLIDMDNETDFLRHFLPIGGEQSRLPPAQRRRNILAALIALGCNIGPQRMAAASPGIGFREISQITNWYFTEESLKAASVDLVNAAARLPLSRLWGQGDTCSADGMRFYVPLNILAADFSTVLGDRGVTLLAHTTDNYLRLHQKPIPCRLREATFCLDGLLEHETELDPKICYTDTHGFTEVVMATAALLGKELAPRLRDIKDQTLYKMDRSQKHPQLDPLLTGTIQANRIIKCWDEVVRVIASLRARHVSPSLLLHRLGSYARQNSIQQALTEIGRVYKTAFILSYLDDESLRRRIGRELNKGEASHALSRFLCFGKEGMMRGREFEDQLHSFSCLSVLHNAVVAWNTHQLGLLVERLRREGHTIMDVDLVHIAPLMRKHINPFGKYHFDLNRMQRAQRE